MTALAAIPGIGPALPYFAAVIAIGAAVSTMLPPPADGSPGWYRAVYAVVQWCGLNKGHAANAAPVAKAPPLANRPPPLVAVLVLGTAMLVLGACSGNSVAQSQVALTLAERLALQYVTLPACTPAGPKACSDAAIVAQIKAADTLAYQAVKQAQAGTIDPAQAAAEVAALAALIPATVH